jgi:NAD(P)H dehydrogenase (quinone)
MIGVLGATGRVGGEVAALLVERGAEARALIRRPASLPLPAVHADLAEPATLPAALDGIGRLLLITSHGPDQEAREAAAVDAATRAGVARIVKVSGGAPSLGPNGAASTAVAHWRVEQRIEAAGIEFAFLRPSFYMQNLLDTVAPAVRKAGVLVAPFGDAPIAMVDARDVAASAVAALLDDEPAHHAWQITGPRPTSFAAVAAHCGACHLKVPVTAVARTLRRRGASDFEVDHAVRMAAYFAAGSDGSATDHVLRLTGRPPRSVEDFLDEHHFSFTPETGLARALQRNHKKEAH